MAGISPATGRGPPVVSAEVGDSERGARKPKSCWIQSPCRNQDEGRKLALPAMHKYAPRRGQQDNKVEIRSTVKYLRFRAPTSLGDSSLCCRKAACPAETTHPGAKGGGPELPESQS